MQTEIALEDPGIALSMLVKQRHASKAFSKERNTMSREGGRGEKERKREKGRCRRMSEKRRHIFAGISMSKGHAYQLRIMFCIEEVVLKEQTK